jgi:hypothetical protein
MTEPKVLPDNHMAEVRDFQKKVIHESFRAQAGNLWRKLNHVGPFYAIMP